MALNHAFDEDKKPNRVVLIGAGGFVGRVLQGWLDAKAIQTLALTSRTLDLLSPDAGERLRALLDTGDAVVMLSALTPDRGRDVATFQRNIAMAETVCSALRAQPVAHVVYVSSDAVYAMQTQRISEETPAAPEDLYGLMHRARELMFRQAVAGHPLAILRPTMIVGLEDTHDSYGPNRFRRLAMETGCITLGGQGEETRDHIFVDDVATLIGRMLLRRSEGLLNAVTGTSWSFAQVAELVASHVGKADVLFSPRSQPVTHRSFDASAIFQAFPDFVPIALPVALDRIFEETMSR